MDMTYPNDLPPHLLYRYYYTWMKNDDSFADVYLDISKEKTLWSLNSVKCQYVKLKSNHIL